MTSQQISDKRIREIEQLLIEVRQLFALTLDKMSERKKDVWGHLFKDTPFSSAQIKALAAFHEDKQYSMGELSKNAQVTMPSMTEMVDALESAGVIERRRDAHDRRRVNVRLTKNGKKVHKEFLIRRRQGLSQVFGALDEDERLNLHQALQTASYLLKKVNRNKE